MKRIQITQGKEVLVDNNDFEYLSRWSWQYNIRTGYVTRSQWVRDSEGKWTKHKTVYMHKEVLSRKGFITDHINRDKLDCRRTNLRIATQAQNTHNAKTRKDNKAGYKGVVWRPKSRDYVAYINVNNKRIWLKTHHILEDAIAARKLAETKYHGEFALSANGG